jgi:hypothetical protein
MLITSLRNVRFHKNAEARQLPLPDVSTSTGGVSRRWLFTGDFVEVEAKDGR